MSNKILSLDDINNYNTDGYLVKNNILDQNELKVAKKGLFRNYCKYNSPKEENISENFVDTTFDKQIIDFRKKYPKNFGNFYDTCQTSASILNLATNIKVRKIASEVIKCDIDTMSWSGLLFRMDVPTDNRNILDWHQDQNHLPISKNGLSAVVITIPLQDTSKNMGSVNLVKRSHAYGTIEPIREKSKDINKSLQLKIPEKLINKENIIVPELKSSDILVMNMNLFHKSGFNSSNKVRYSLIIRYHSSENDSFSTFKRVELIS